MDIVCHIIGYMLEIRNAPLEVVNYFKDFICDTCESHPDIVVTVKNIDEIAGLKIRRPTMQPVFGIRFAKVHENGGNWEHVLTADPGGKEQAAG